MRVETNIPVVANNILQQFEQLKDVEYLLRPVVLATIERMHKRIHVDGKAADDSQIGTYSPEYMKVRTGNFLNSPRFSRGAKKGQAKNAGAFTFKTVKVGELRMPSPNTGKQRPNYNRSNDTKIIVSLTRQLENDWNVIALENGYGIGFLNQFNAQKAQWVEEQKDKLIFSTTASEETAAIEQINELVAQALS